LGGGIYQCRLRIAGRGDRSRRGVGGRCDGRIWRGVASVAVPSGVGLVDRAAGARGSGEGVSSARSGRRVLRSAQLLIVHAYS
jgi:hypothetical protein